MPRLEHLIYLPPQRPILNAKMLFDCVFHGGKRQIVSQALYSVVFSCCCCKKEQQCNWFGMHYLGKRAAACVGMYGDTNMQCMDLHTVYRDDGWLEDWWQPIYMTQTYEIIQHVIYLDLSLCPPHSYHTFLFVLSLCLSISMYLCLSFAFGC